MRLLESLGYVVPGVALLAAAAYVMAEGRVLGRSGFTSLTQSSHPLAFWGEVGCFLAVGFLLVLYGLARWLKVARAFTGALDEFAQRVVGRSAGGRRE